MSSTFLLLSAFSIPRPEILVPLAVFVGIAAMVWWVAGMTGSVSETTVEDRLDELRHGRRREEPTENSAANRSKQKKEAMAAVLEKATRPLAATVTGNAEEMDKLRIRLLHAGFRREQAPVVFKGLQLILGTTGLALGGLGGLLYEGLSNGMMMKAIIAGGIGFYAPVLLLAFCGSKRKEAIFLGLPDALDLMVVCVEAGLGLDQAMRKVGEEMEKSHKVIAEEYKIANQQLQFGRPRSEVLQALGQRSGVEDLQQLASILIQADKFGSSVGQALRVQSDAMRVHRRQLAEEKAAKTAVKMIFPLVLFIFPGIFVVLVGPAAITMYHNLLTM
jgi:tight adherence protein C